MTQEEKMSLCVAGEYGVASELAKRGYNVNITMGNTKSIDIIISKVKSLIKEYKTIQVKTSRSNRIVTGFFQRYTSINTPSPDFWVLVHIDQHYNSQYYILTHKELAGLQMKRNNMTEWEYVKGCDNVLLSSLSPYLNMWDKIRA